MRIGGIGGVVEGVSAEEDVGPKPGVYLGRGHVGWFSAGEQGHGVGLVDFCFCCVAGVGGMEVREMEGCICED